jgi:hypothetical protein
LIPATPFLWAFAAPGLARFRYIAIAAIVVSVVNMMAITAVRAQFPGPTMGPATADNPAVECIVRVRKDQLAHDPGSFNWGLLAGMKGKWSLLPPLAVVIGLGIWSTRGRAPRSMGVPPMSSEEHGRDAQAT